MNSTKNTYRKIAGSIKLPSGGYVTVEDNKTEVIIQLLPSPEEASKKTPVRHRRIPKGPITR